MTTHNPFFWENLHQHPPEVQEQILKELEDMMGDLTWEEQAGTFQGAPPEIILKFLPKLAWEAQARVYKKHLAVKAREQAKPLLSREAKIALKLRKRKQCLA